MLLFGEYPIYFEMALKTDSGSVIMYDNIAGGLDNNLNNFSL